MADGRRERTALLLTDYLEYCAREPRTPARAPSTPEAAVLRCVAAQIQEDNSHFSYYRGFRGDRVELVARMAQELLADDQGPSWGRVASLLTFAGTLLERPPPGTWGPREKEGISRNCRLLVASLCVQFSGLHRTWLVAHGGWVPCSCQISSNSWVLLLLGIESGENVCLPRGSLPGKRRAHRRTEIC
ncbi:bcl-2-like protein 10 isoform X2 [Camelus ferus]|uniref:Bcl-2-like protein 10 n=1 Tax=Camelus ferus TaxID=419612 RepID=A0A8B8T480_CAMFR|nr:bcl-2-like protein 10 isoform X2 [Camelus ferus]